MRKYISILLTISILTVCVIGTACAEDFQLRNGILFGDTLEIIKQKETLPFKSITDDNLKAWFGNGKISGIDGQVRFDFDEETGKMKEMLYAFDTTDNKEFVDSDYEKLKNGLLRKYGTPLGNTGGKINLITGEAFDYAALLIYLYQYIKGDGDFRDYEEWIVKCDGYNVKIDLVSYYYRDKDYNYTYQNLISYHYYTDEDALNAIQQKQEENDTVDSDL